MPLPVERLRTIVFAQLTELEKQKCVVYLSADHIAPGEKLSFPRLTFECSAGGRLAFVDLNPAANWGHACCYICIDDETGHARRIDAQFPPFRPRKGDRSAQQWQVIYRAPGVPAALVMSPEQ